MSIFSSGDAKEERGAYFGACRRFREGVVGGAGSESELFVASVRARIGDYRGNRELRRCSGGLGLVDQARSLAKPHSCSLGSAPALFARSLPLSAASCTKLTPRACSALLIPRLQLLDFGIHHPAPLNLDSKRSKLNNSQPL